MAQLPQQFDATQVDPSQGGSFLPPVEGQLVHITASEFKETKDKNGSYFCELTMMALEGPYAGLTTKDRLNLVNNGENKEATERMANQQLSAYCHVTGMFQVADTTQLHNRPFRINVKAQSDNSEYTNVSKVMDVNGNEPGKAPTQPPAAPAAPVAPSAPQPPAAQPPFPVGTNAPQQAAPTPPPANPAWPPTAPAAPGAPAAPAPTAAPVTQPPWAAPAQP